jgi:ABC-type antimicrobial peptide transport system permease subunit
VTFRSALDAIDANVPIWIGPLSVDAFIASMGNYWLLGNNTAMFTLFAVIALALAALGIYAVVASSVSRRTKEFGVRRAIGGTPRDILTLVLGENAATIFAGLLIGIVAALELAPVLRSQLVHVSSRDPITVVLASGVLVCCGLVGCLLPAYRATRIPPGAALRVE